MKVYDVIIIGTGPAGLGAAFALLNSKPALKVLLLDKAPISSGGLRNDCKMNFTYPIGFSRECWDRETAERYLAQVKMFLKPDILYRNNMKIYNTRAERLGVTLLDIEQAHLGTDGGLRLIKQLIARLKELGAHIALKEEVLEVGATKLRTAEREIGFGSLVIAPGRGGFRFLQKVMESMGIPYLDNIIDIGIRLETRMQYYPIVEDYYDPKFLFPHKVRTFCTNSKRAYVVKERYETRQGIPYFSINGHAYSSERRENGLVNFALLKTVQFTEPLASGQEFAEMLGLQAVLMGGGKPLMQRVGDFRLGKRSKKESFTDDDLYNFEPSLAGCTPGDISLAMPAKILRAIWQAMKSMDAIVPGILHPSTIMYYPEIKLYANKPAFIDQDFMVKEGIYMVGDGAGTSRGITAAWASGIRAAESILKRV